MAFTNSSRHADHDQFDDQEEVDGGTGTKRRRGAARLARPERKGSRFSNRQERVRALSKFEGSGLPALSGLKPVLMFLSVPALLVLALTATGGGWPASVLYPIAVLLGLVLTISAFKGVELVLACMIIYLPFSKVFVVPLAPGVNGTNMLVLLGLFAALLRAANMRKELFNWPPGAILVIGFGFLSCLSAITIIFLPGGRSYLIYNELLSYKAWVDQFIFYFIAMMCIRDTETAKRCFIYLMLGSVLVVLYSVPEMLDKMGRSTIDKSRIGGPHLQSNNFGGYVAYTVVPLIAVFTIYIKDLRAWLLTPYFLLTAKVLITTFSRGAYLAILVGGLMAGWYKGKMFLLSWVALALCIFLIFPTLLPEAISARMSSLTSEQSSSSSAEENLDKSSSTRLIMWRAAAVMITEDPVWGKGFKGFPFLKEDYTEMSVEESDPHSMYLYIGSQMGLPALSLFLLILSYSFYLGRMHSRSETDRFIKAIGIGGAAATACYAVVCIFGSRAVSLNFTSNFWTMLVILQVLKQKQTEAEKAGENSNRKRTNAFEQKNELQSATASESVADAVPDTDFDESPDQSDAIEGEFAYVHGESSPEAELPDSKPGRAQKTVRSRKKTSRGVAAHRAASAAQSTQLGETDGIIPPASRKRRFKR